MLLAGQTWEVSNEAWVIRIQSRFGVIGFQFAVHHPRRIVRRRCVVRSVVRKLSIRTASIERIEPVRLGWRRRTGTQWR